MRKNSVNRKIVRSIGVGILAAMTTCTSVYAAADMDVMPGESDPTEGIDVEEQEPEKQVLPSEETPVNQEVSEIVNSLENVQGELEKVQDNLKTPEGEETTLGIGVGIVKEDVADAKEAVDELGKEVNKLTELNGTADEKRAEYEAVTDEALKEYEKNEEGQYIEGWVNNVQNAEQSAGAAEGTANDANRNTAQKLEEVKELYGDGKLYENEDAAKAAQEQAQKAAQEADEAYREAQRAKDQAECDLQNAQDALELLGGKYGEARDTYAEAVAAVEEAQRVLNAIVADEGFTIGEITYEGGKVSEAKTAAENALKDAQVALTMAGAELDTARGDYAIAENNLKITQEKYNKVSEMLEMAGDDRETAYKELGKLDEAVNDKYGQYTDAVDKYDTLKDAIDTVENINAAQKQYDEAMEELDKLKDETADKLIEAENKLIQLHEEDKDVSSHNQYIDAADNLAKEMISYMLGKSGMTDISDEGWKKPGGENNYIKYKYKEGGQEREIYFDYVICDDGRIDIVQKASEYKSLDLKNSLIAEVKDNKTVFKLNGELIEPERIEYKNGTYFVDGKRYHDWAFVEGGEGEGKKGQSYYTAEQRDNYVAAKADVEKRVAEYGDNLSKLKKENPDAAANLEKAIKDAKEAELAKDETHNYKDILAEVGAGRENRKTGLDEAIDSYVANLGSALAELKTIKDAAGGKVESLEARNETIKGSFENVNKVCEQVKDISTVIAQLTAQMDIDAGKLTELETKYGEMNDRLVATQSMLEKMDEEGSPLKLAQKAAELALQIAGQNFNFIQPTPPTGGGDGGETGGGTDGGTTPGGTDDTTPGTATGDGTGDGAGDGGTTDETEAAVIPVVTDATAPAAPAAVTALDADGAADAAVVRTVAGNGAGADLLQADAGGEADADGEETDTVQLEDDEVPLASVDLDQAEEEGAEQTIEDEELPLAITDLETEQSRMSWWWLLIIAVLGAAGTEMYRRHRKNMEEEGGAE